MRVQFLLRDRFSNGDLKGAAAYRDHRVNKVRAIYAAPARDLMRDDNASSMPRRAGGFAPARHSSAAFGS